jgi:hypothetical protein
LFPNDEPISTIRPAGVETKPDDRDGFETSPALAVPRSVGTPEFMRDCPVIQLGPHLRNGGATGAFALGK